MEWHKNYFIGANLAPLVPTFHLAIMQVACSSADGILADGIQQKAPKWCVQKTGSGQSWSGPESVGIWAGLIAHVWWQGIWSGHQVQPSPFICILSSHTFHPGRHLQWRTLESQNSAPPKFSALPTCCFPFLIIVVVSPAGTLKLCTQSYRTSHNPLNLPLTFCGITTPYSPVSGKEMFGMYSEAGSSPHIVNMTTNVIHM